MRKMIIPLFLLCWAASLRAGTAEDSLLLRQEQLIQEVIEQIHIDSLLTQVRILSGEQATLIDGTVRTIVSRHRLQPGNALAAKYLSQELKRHGLSPFIDYFGSQGENVVAFQEGYLHPEQQFMICAHYDCMPAGPLSYGADDNASGTAAVLEAARLLAGRRMPFTVAYALWDEEEAGLLGARAYAEQVFNLGHRILGVINMDMIAYDGNDDAIVTLHVRPIAQSLDLGQRLADINLNYQLGLNPWIVNPGTPNSDQAAFWEKNYSAVLVIEDYRRGTAVNDFNPFYHSTNDRIVVDGKTIFNLSYFLACARMSIGALASYAFDVAPPAPQLAAVSSPRPVRTLLAWSPAARSREYLLQVSQDPSFQTVEYQGTTAGDTSRVPGRLAYDQDYFWRVSGRNRGGRGEWSSSGAFVTSGPRQVTLTLQPGWNLVSAGVAPDDSILADLLPEHGLLLRDGEGRRFGPDFGWDERKSWSCLEGYWLHSADARALVLSGWEINTAPAPLPLRAGWQILPYWRSAPLEIDEALASLRAPAGLIKDAEGRIYWPEEGIREIPTLEPGAAYQLFLYEPDTLTYPLNGTPFAIDRPAERLAGSTLHYQPPARTGVTSHLLLETEGLAQGDEVGVWADGSLLVGAGKIEGDKLLMTLWGDDIASVDDVDGARAGSTLNFTLWNETMALERALTLAEIEDGLSCQALSLPLAFAADGVWRGRAGEVEAIPQSFTLYQNYPNPFNETTVLRYVLPRESRVLLRIFNLQGREVARLVDGGQRAGIYEQKYRPEGLASGLYWAELLTDEARTRIKMMLVR